MADPSFQTVRLSRGSHLSAQHGACVMKLTSMLAGERFSDHPRTACPVVAALLRAYNDGTTDGRRQDLYAFATAAVGTRDRRRQRERLERCERFLGRWLDGRRRLSARSRARAIYRAGLLFAAEAGDAAHERFLRFAEGLIGEPAVDAGAAALRSGRATAQPRAYR
jgi:hypothetical protein